MQSYRPRAYDEGVDSCSQGGEDAGPGLGMAAMADRLGNAALQTILHDHEPDASVVFAAGMQASSSQLSDPLGGREPLTVHRGPEADAALAALNAEGATFGADILLSGAAGPDVLAHEASHVVQNRGGQARRSGLDQGSSSPTERQADACLTGGQDGLLIDALAGPVPEVQRFSLGEAWDSVSEMVGDAWDSAVEWWTGEPGEESAGKTEKSGAGDLPDGLHFFPGSLRIIFVTSGKVVGEFEAHGGPEKEQPPPANGTMPAGPTDTGEFRMAGTEAYHTPSWDWSALAWGTPLQDKGDDVWYQLKSGKYGSIEKDFGISRKAIIDKNQRLYDVAVVPSTWVFNDFGPVAARYYRDANGNGKQDANEPLEGEMIHTTPADEADTAQGDPFTLDESHGCIHIRPADRDQLMKMGAFNPGVPFTVHGYGEQWPAP